MGNDGGSIPRRHELVPEDRREPTRSERKASALASLGHAWSHCRLSGERLDVENAVADWQGWMYNYEAVLHGLLSAGGDDNTDTVGPEEDQFEEEQQQRSLLKSAQITSLRDVVRLHFTTVPGESTPQKITCPLSQKELGPGTRAVYLVPCGHVFAEAAIQELAHDPDGAKKSTQAEDGPSGPPEREKGQVDEGRDEGMACFQCSEPCRLDRDVLPLLPMTEADRERVARRYETLRELGLTHSLKKDKSKTKNKTSSKKPHGEKHHGEKRNGEKHKGKKRPTEDDEKGDEGESISSQSTSFKSSSQSSQSMSRGKGREPQINSAIAASVTAKVKAEQEERHKRRRLEART